MKYTIIPFLLFFLITPAVLKSQENKDAVITGHVVSKGEHIPFVNIYIENTTIGTATDITGHYLLVDLPIGEYTLVAKMVGYKIEKKSS